MDYYRIAHMILNVLMMTLIVKSSLEVARRQCSGQSEPVIEKISLEANDLGAASKNRLMRLIHVLAKREESNRISLGTGSYVIGSNFFASFLPRYILLIDSLGSSFKIAAEVQVDGTLRLSVLRGCMSLNGVTYRRNPNQIFSVHKGEAFWIGQTEVKVK
ncbi:MAG: hypothetical protein Q4A32_06780 [Lachnospiraceae bacterium]|nr:hypothetical protein [Lachnospiraceae bacterium]